MSSFLTEVLFDSSTFSTLEHQMPAFAGHFQDSMLQRQVHSSSILRKGNLFVGHPSYALLRSKQPVLRHHRDFWPRHSTGFWFFRNRHCWFVFCAHLKKEVCSSSTNASIRHIALVLVCTSIAEIELGKDPNQSFDDFNFLAAFLSIVSSSFAACAGVVIEKLMKNHKDMSFFQQSIWLYLYWIFLGI